MMYLCLDCEKLFEEPYGYIETHGLNTPPYEEWSCCPKCRGAYVKTKRCSVCDEWIVGEFAELKNGMSVCESCFVVRDIGDEVFGL